MSSEKNSESLTGSAEKKCVVHVFLQLFQSGIAHVRPISIFLTRPSLFLFHVWNPLRRYISALDIHIVVPVVIRGLTKGFHLHRICLVIFSHVQPRPFVAMLVGVFRHIEPGCACYAMRWSRQRVCRAV